MSEYPNKPYKEGRRMSKEKKEARQARDAKVAELEAIVKAAEAESREFTPEESEARGRLTVEISQAEDRLQAVKAAEREALKAEAVAEARASFGYGAYDTNSPGGSLKVNSEHRTYERGNGESYLKDVATIGFPVGAVGGRWFEAMERLQRHAKENHVEAVAVDEKYENSRSAEESYFLGQMIEAKNNRKDNRGHAYSYRALSTAAGSGGEFVPPLYLTQDWIAFMRAARALADCQNHQPLPDGTMVINLPKITRGTAVGPQSGGQNTPVLEVDLETEYVTFPVVVKSGGQLISLQLLERSPVAFDQITFQDMGKAYAQAVDVAVAYGDGGQDVVGILNTDGIFVQSWSTTSSFITGLYGQLGQVKTDIATSLFMPATHAFMPPVIWEYIASQFDSQKRPLVVPSYQGPFNAAVLGTDGVVVEGAVGRRISGLDTYEDANLPTISSNNVVLAGRFDQNLLFESPIVTRVLPQTYGNQLSVLLQVYGYIAFTAARYPNANAVITGGALATPTFAS
jgi:HK97 family phage major capsid protein